jgi:hypothetical protein
MILAVILASIISSATSTTYLRLSNYGQTTLSPGDSIISTAGNYRMTLIASGCRLDVERFTTNAYVSVGAYTSSTAPGDCLNLILQPVTGNVLNDKSLVYIPMGQSCNLTTLTIDDSAVIRLTCIPQLNAQIVAQGYEWNYTNLRTNNTYMYSVSWQVVTTLSTLSPITNLGGWTISASNGRFLLTSTSNSNQTVSYNYTAFSVYPVAIQDLNGN